MDVEAADLGQRAGVGTIGSDELGDDAEDLAGINGQTLAVEGSVSHAVRVEIASVRIAKSAVTRCRGSTALGTGAFGLANSAAARVWGVSRGNLVRFPDIHLRAA